MGDSGEESNFSTGKRRSRMARCNTAQLSAMVQFLSRNRDMTIGKAGNLSSVTLNSKWNLMATKLSKLGPVKTGTQWKMVWRDVKCKTKAKYKAMHDPRRSHSKPIVMSEHENKIILYLMDEAKFETNEMGCYMDEYNETIKPEISPAVSPTRSASSDSDNVLSTIRTTCKDSNPLASHTEPDNVSSSNLTAAGLRVHIDNLMKIENERNDSMKEMSDAVKRLADAQEAANQQNKQFQQFMREILPEILNRLPACDKNESNMHSGLNVYDD